MFESVCSECGSTYLKHPRSRLSLCCRCRPKRKKKDRVLSRLGIADNAIKSEEELVNYFAQDQLECLECGERHAGLYRHILLAHKISTREYKLKYGIPITCGLVGMETKNKMANSGKQTSEKMRVKNYENLKTARAERGKTRVSWPTYHRDAHIKNMVLSENHPSNIKGLDVMPCKKCGSDVYIAANISVALQCYVMCDSCK